MQVPVLYHAEWGSSRNLSRPSTFLLYINDIFDALPDGCSCSLFADDANVFTINNCDRLQESIDTLVKWASIWELDISIQKTAVMLIGKNHPSYTFKIDGNPLAIIHEVRDLGVYYSDELNFKCHIDRIVSRANSIANFILRAFKTRDITVLFRLSVMYARPILEYCSPVWSPYCRSDIELIEGVQKSFTYRCFARIGNIKISYGQRLKKLGAPTLEHRRVVADFGLMYKFISREISIKLTDLFELSQAIGTTRGHAYRIRPDKTNTRSFQGSFLGRVVPLWNRLDSSFFQWKKSSLFQIHLAKFLA